MFSLNRLLLIDCRRLAIGASTPINLSSIHIGNEDSSSSSSQNSSSFAASTPPPRRVVGLRPLTMPKKAEGGDAPSNSAASSSTSAKLPAGQYHSSTSSSSSSSQLHNNNNRKGGGGRSGGGRHRLSPQATNSKPTSVVLTSNKLTDFLEKFWICVFGFSGGNHLGALHTQQNAEIARYISWYGGRMRFVPLDTHVHGDSLALQIQDWRRREEAAARAELAERQRDSYTARLAKGMARAEVVMREQKSNSGGIDGEEAAEASEEEGARSPSLEPSHNRHLYTRSNLTEFGQLFISPTTIPAVFVNQHYLGGLEDIQILEKQRKLKDIIQFGFEWKTSNFLKPMASQYNDDALFKGAYQGAPIVRPTAMLPQVSTRFNVDDPYEGLITRAPSAYASTQHNGGWVQ